MKHITLGIVAHVDAGKTTLSESLMYKTGNLRKLGRVDNGDTFLDPDELEKKRGITIFSHNAKISSPNFEMTLLDTPGHIDFASQTIEALSVLDYAILVVSALDGVTGYTKQLWNLLKKYQIPAFIFVNKMDIHEVAKTSILKDLQENLDTNCIDFMEKGDDFYENVATTDENLLDKYLNGESIEEDIPKLVAQRKIFPVYFGSALKLDGIDDLLQGLEKWSIEPQYENGEFIKLLTIKKASV